MEGRNLTLEFRWADGKQERLADLAAELVRLPVDLIVTWSTPGARAAQHATTTLPIVVANMADPVEQGMVESLARPGGNITGSVLPQRELQVSHDGGTGIYRLQPDGTLAATLTWGGKTSHATMTRAQP